MELDTSLRGQPSLTITAGFEETLRIEIITVGETYRIEPLNARQSKFDTQLCTVLRFLEQDTDHLPYAAVVFLLASKRHAQIELVDLAAISQSKRQKRLFNPYKHLSRGKSD